MTYIDDLMNELCPDGVEWKELGEVLVKGKGTKITASKMKELHKENAPVRIFAGGKTYADVNYDDIPQKDIHTEKSIIVKSRGVIEFEYYTKPFSFKNEFWSYRVANKGVNLRYVYYYLNHHQNHFQNIANNMQMPQISSRDTEKFKIPVPPLQVQEEIVKILDNFTNYLTELTAELTKRLKQYFFFRDKLLSFEDEVYEVEWKSLGEVGLPVQNISWIEQGEQEYSYIDLSSVDRESKKIIHTIAISSSTAPSRAQRIVKEDDILFGTTRPTLRRYAKVTKEFDNQICSTGFYVFRASDRIIPNYVYHILGSSEFNKYVEENQTGASYPAISNSVVEKFKIPVPSLEIQSRIVQALDNFDAVCHDLNIGLPKEIDLRQKQYEYFREKLLTFAGSGIYTQLSSAQLSSHALIRFLTWVFGPIRVRVGAINTISRGVRVTKNQLNESGKYPVYQNSLIPLGFYSESNEKSDTTFIISAGAAGEIGFSRKAFWKADDVWTLTSESINQKFLYYTLMKHQPRIKNQVRRASVPRLSRNVIENLIICLPNLEYQNRIVSILDKFDTLTSDLTQGLPKEIAQRQAQYEYYRDKLLSFKRKA